MLQFLELTPDQYDACLLYFGYGLSLDDVADELGIRRAAACRRICRARAKYPMLRRRYNRRASNPFTDAP
jgi:DNA-directed RNA polymerase specialized sigma24 family protein